MTEGFCQFCCDTVIFKRKFNKTLAQFLASNRWTVYLRTQKTKTKKCIILHTCYQNSWNCMWTTCNEKKPQKIKIYGSYLFYHFRNKSIIFLIDKYIQNKNCKYLIFINSKHSISIFLFSN